MSGSEPRHAAEIAAAKINLALHVRGRLPDGRHALETLFAFCVDGDRVEGWWSEEGEGMSLEVGGPFAGELDEGPNLIERAWELMQERTGRGEGHTIFRLTKNLPVASGIGGGSADAAAALRLMTRLWEIDPAHASAVAPLIGADVPACLLSLSCWGEGAGDSLELCDPGVSGAAILLVNPQVPLSTAKVFAAWDGQDPGALSKDWRSGRNDLEPPARALVPEIGDVLDWLGEQEEVTLARMSGSGATCFAFFESEEARDAAAATCPEGWWHLATSLR